MEAMKAASQSHDLPNKPETLQETIAAVHRQIQDASPEDSPAILEGVTCPAAYLAACVCNSQDWLDAQSWLDEAFLH